MKHLSLSVAGALLLAGSMAVYAQAQQPPKEPMVEEQKPAQDSRQQQPQSKEGQGERAKSDQSEGKQGQDNKRSEQTEKSGKPEGAGKQGSDQAGSGGSAAQEGQRAEKSGDSSKGQKRHAGKKLEAKQRTVVRESIGKRNMRPTKVNFSINVGAVVPRTVVLYDMPDTLIEFEPDYSRYKFIMSDDNTILVIDPETWTVIDVIEI